MIRDKDYEYDDEVDLQVQERDEGSLFIDEMFEKTELLPNIAANGSLEPCHISLHGSLSYERIEQKHFQSTHIFGISKQQQPQTTSYVE